MTSTDERPTIAERYAVASETSNMRVKLDAPGPADVIVAAAFSGEPGGALFNRLRSEFDQAKAEIRHEAAGQSIGAANERMLIMMRLKSLKAAKAETRCMADDRAHRRGYDGLGSSELDNLAWQALSVWIDPRCAPCGGRGFTGGYDGQPQMTCRRCDAGNRRGFAGRSDAERSFVEGIVTDIEEAMQRFETGTVTALRR